MAAKTISKEPRIYTSDMKWKSRRGRCVKEKRFEYIFRFRGNGPASRILKCCGLRIRLRLFPIARRHNRQSILKKSRRKGRCSPWSMSLITQLCIIILKQGRTRICRRRRALLVKRLFRVKTSWKKRRIFASLRISSRFVKNLSEAKSIRFARPEQSIIM